MSERELIEKLGVGRSSLREAMRAMEAMGIVETRAGEGTFVAVDSRLGLKKHLEWGVFAAKKTVFQIYEARRVIEISIMPLIVERISAAQIESLRKLLHAMEETKETADLQRFLDIDYLFHKNLAEYTNNDILKEVISLTYRILNEERRSSLKSRKDYEKALLLHCQIVDSLEARSARAATRAMKDHMDYTKKLLGLSENVRTKAIGRPQRAVKGVS